MVNLFGGFELTISVDGCLVSSFAHEHIAYFVHGVSNFMLITVSRSSTTFILSDLLSLFLFVCHPNHIFGILCSRSDSKNLENYV
jgi:hypothetical protein